MQPLVFEKDSFVFQEKSDHSQLLGISIHIVCAAITLPRNVISKQCSVDGVSLIETMIAEIDVVLKGIQSLSRRLVQI